MAKAPKQEKAAAGAKAAPAASAKKPATPAPAPANVTTDKFGLALLVLVLVTSIATLVVWGKAGVERASIDLFGMFQDTAQEYDAKSSQAKILQYSSTGSIGGDPSLTDTVLINQGRMHGVRVGDVFTPSSPDKDNAFVEYCVSSVQDTTCIATVKTNLDLAPGEGGSSGEKDGVNTVRVSSKDAYPAEATNVERKWAKQTTRKLAVARK